MSARKPKVRVVQRLNSNELIQGDVRDGRAVLVAVDMSMGGLHGVIYKGRQEIHVSGREGAAVGSTLATRGGRGDVADWCQEHGATVVHVSEHLIRHDIEHGTPIQELVKGMAEVTAVGADVELAWPTQPEPDPPAAPAPSRVGESVVDDVFARGSVTAVPDHLLSSLSSLKNAMSRTDVRQWCGHAVTAGTVVDLTFCSPDRLEARQHASTRRETWHRSRADQPGQAYLEAVLRSFEPALLLVERQAVDVGGLDLKAAAKDHCVAIGVWS